MQNIILFFHKCINTYYDLIQQNSRKQDKNLPFIKPICQNGAYLYLILNTAMKRAFTVSHAVLFTSSRASHALGGRTNGIQVWACSKLRQQKKKGLPISMVTKTTNPNKIMGVGLFGVFLQLSSHKEFIMETKSNVKSSHAFIFVCQPSVFPLFFFLQLQYVIAINVLQGCLF